MKFAYKMIVLAAFGALVACGGGGDSGDAVASTPLTGTIQGKDFTAKSAIGNYDTSDQSISITIYDHEVSCDDFAPSADGTVLISVPWTANTARNFKFSFGSADAQTATFYSGGTNIISTEGRVEVIDAPTENKSVGKIRLRATADTSDIEGEVPVTVCVPSES